MSRCHECYCYNMPPCGNCVDCQHIDFPDCPNDCQECPIIHYDDFEMVVSPEEVGENGNILFVIRVRQSGELVFEEFRWGFREARKLAKAIYGVSLPFPESMQYVEMFPDRPVITADYDRTFSVYRNAYFVDNFTTHESAMNFSHDLAAGKVDKRK